MSRRPKQSERDVASGKSPSSTVAEDTRAYAPAEAGILQSSLFARPSVRAAVSVLLLLHLLAIFIAPLAARPNASAISRFLVSWFQPYIDTAYLNHGYGFFSPDPGSSLLIRYEVELPDGTLENGVLPDRAEHWPRLLYHRHFMLSSQSDALPGLPEAYARHLKHVYSAKRVKLQLVEHVPAGPQNILDGRVLTDPESYIVRSEATLDEAGKYTPRLLTPPAGEEIPPESPIVPGGPPGGRIAPPTLEPSEYRGPLAPQREGAVP